MATILNPCRRVTYALLKRETCSRGIIIPYTAKKNRRRRSVAVGEVNERNGTLQL